MRPLDLRAGLLAATLAVACGPSSPKLGPPTGQIMLYVDTDAPLATAAGGPVSRDAPLPLFDRVRIELFEPDATTPCDGCVNEFSLDAGRLADVKASVGLVPTPGISGYRARVRLYNLAFATPGSEPDRGSTIEVVTALPAIGSHDVVDVTVTLLTDNVGLPIGTLEAPAPFVRGRPSASQVGTWWGGARLPCAAPPAPGEVCVPGGAFWFGNPNMPGILQGADSPRLVVLSPFYLDATEATVATVRARGPVPRHGWSGSSTGAAYGDWCTFTQSGPGPFEALPVNCISWPEAQTYCQAQGKDLPTEAQFEYAAGGLEGRIFVWGSDEASCADAVFGRANGPLYLQTFQACRGKTPPGGAAPPGSGARDALVLPTGTIVDLGGNMAEWARDMWNQKTEPCWSDPRVYVDPVCATPSPADGPQRTAKGGAWYLDASELAASMRLARTEQTADLGVGFRCARVSGP